MNPIPMYIASGTYNKNFNYWDSDQHSLNCNQILFSCTTQQYNVYLNVL